MFAFIGGTGFYRLGRKCRERKVKTKYGTAALQECEFLSEKVFFLPRHGPSHSLPPHRINYLANVAALEKLGVSGVMSVFATGAISKYSPGDLVLVDDFISFWMPSTFYDDFSGGIKHVDFSDPFDADMRKALLESASAMKTRLRKGGIVATTPGPRFETKAEIKALKAMGANLVSMTFGHEAPLIGEAEIPHAALAIATNYACGISRYPLNDNEVFDMMSKRESDVLGLLEGLLQRAR